VRSFREDQRIPRVSTCVASSEGWEPVQDVYCCARTGYWSCSTTRRGWQGVSVAYVSRHLLDAKTRYVSWRNFAYLYIMRAPSLGIISFLVLA
jgi:hypothetical protein